ncbi:PTS fructose transporter subunit IIC [Gluconacetobacter sp.]|uniref:PTS fructose transporter subunit IIC n=1 Tax=Gluconacetobacter sp. TaxID=1935994 RepID=UPI0039E7799E
MKHILAVIQAGEESVTGVLAGEALRRAGRETGRTLDIEIRTTQGILNPLPDGAPGKEDVLLLIGTNAPTDDALTARADRHLTLEAVLADPGRALAALDDARGAAPPETRAPRIVAVTSCPTGIAHTFMAAEGLQEAARQLGYTLRVETQGSVGAGTPLTDAEIAEADLVLIAADREVDRSRFGGKRVYVTGAKPAITGGAAVISKALAEATVQPVADGGSSASRPAGKGERAGPYKHLMTGVSFMLPFVVSGGLLIALAFALGGIHASDAASAGTLAHTLFTIGSKAAFMLMVPALAGYIAFSVADRPGLAPGMIGGLLAANVDAGFLGGIAAGFIAGYAVEGLNRLIRLPRTLQGLKPILILPLLGTLITGLLTVYAIGGPVAALMAFLTDWLRGMQGSSALLLGLILGAMSAFDMGGPVNKAGYAFSVGLIASAVYTPMAATMVAGMVPPLAAALATRLFRARFTAEEREAGATAAVLGLAFITEGAIPFAARDPLRIIPALMAGSATAGAITMVSGVELKVPHGGVFVLPIPGAVTHLGAYVVALLAGTVVSAVLIGLLMRSPAKGEALA